MPDIGPKWNIIHPGGDSSKTTVTPAPVANSQATPPEIAGYWDASGKSTVDQTQLAVAIALAESSGNEDADNGIAAGLWQINYHAHPQWTAEQLYDPKTNAHAARVVLASQGWSAWTTYQTGAYKQFMSTARNAALHPEAPTGDGDVAVGAVAGAVGSVASGAWSALTAVPRFLGDLASLFFTEHGWIRLLKIFAGVTIGVIAIHSLFKDTQAGQAVSSGVKTTVSTAAKFAE